MFGLYNIIILDQAAIDQIRQAVVCWYHCEEGAPAIHPSSPMSEFKEDSYIDTLVAFIKASGIDTGPRRFRNPLIGMGPYDRRSHGIPPIYFDGDKLREEIEVDITPDHLKLLAHMTACDWQPSDRPSFDPKRVFNDHRDAAIGAYAALTGDDEGDEEDGIVLSEEDERRYARLHQEMAAVLQVHVREADVEPGIYMNSLFGGFRKVGDADGYTKLRDLFVKRDWFLSRKEYASIIRTRALKDSENSSGEDKVEN
ncbi:hypothetical protein O9X98_08980 [Agrobacterium salinitolerans]|nr:hypothetical protein [Agrobacterium salinitolerans]